MVSELFNGKHEKVLKALDKHLRDNVIIHHENQFKKTEGPSTDSATTVAFRESENSGTKFVMKHQTLQETITEVIAGSLYKVLLYDRSPDFTLCERSDEADTLSLKSNLLNNFTTLCGFVYKRLEKATKETIEEFAHTEELIKHMVAFFSWKGEYKLKEFILILNEEIEGFEEFFASIKEQYNLGKVFGKAEPTKCNIILAEIFKEFESREKSTELKECARDFLYGMFADDIIPQVVKQKEWLHQMHNLVCQDKVSAEEIGYIKKKIKELAPFYKSLDAIADKLDQEGFSLAEIAEEIKSSESILEQVIEKALQRIEGLEKIIVSMMLLGYNDLHSSNIGVMEIEYENRDGSKTTEKVYAKVDMSASFANLKNTDYLYYLRELKFIVFDSRAVHDSHLNLLSLLNWHAAIDYSKLKEEINKSCNLFFNRPEYVKSLINRALFYKKSLLKTEEELGLVSKLAEQIVKQAELLKECANSEEFASLISDKDNLKNYCDQESYMGGEVISKITKRVKDNLRASPLVNNCKRNVDEGSHANGISGGASIKEKNRTLVKQNRVEKNMQQPINALSSEERCTLGIAGGDSDKDNAIPQNTKISTDSGDSGKDNIVLQNTKIVIASSNSCKGNATPQNTKSSKWPIVAASTLLVAGVALGVAIAVYLEMLAVGIVVGACCLVAAAIIYYNKPSNSLEDGDIQGFSKDVKKTHFQN